MGDTTISVADRGISRTTLATLGGDIHAARQTAVANGHTIPDDEAEPPVAAEQAAIEAAEQEGLTYLDYGAARLVFAIDDAYIVKFARYGETDLTDGVQANHRERRLSAELAETFRLLPVVAADHDRDHWVVMPRIDPMGETADIVGDPDLNDLLDELTALAEYIHTPEINPENVAYYNGELHLFDYGRPPVPLDDD